MLAQYMAYTDTVGTLSRLQFLGMIFIKKVMGMLKKFLILFCVAFTGSCSSFDGDDLTNGSYSQGKRLDPNCDHYAVGGSGGGCTPSGQWHLKDKQGQRVPF